MADSSSQQPGTPAHGAGSVRPEKVTVKAAGDGKIQIEFQIDELIRRLVTPSARGSRSRGETASCGGCHGCHGCEH